MITLIGTTDCSRCMITKAILEDRGIKFEYVLLSDLAPFPREHCLQLARGAGNIQMPIIIKDGKSIKLSEV